MPGKIFWIVLITIIGVYLTWYQHITSLPDEFTLDGKIDECCCQTSKLKDVNKRIVNLTNDLTETLFFRIFRVNLNNECPFWAQELLCKNPGQCTVCQCDENEIPLAWVKSPKTAPVSTTQQSTGEWNGEAQRKKIVWHVEDKENESGEFVDLKKNPEKYTGYQGQRIWNTIYSENCFKGSLEDMCVEERLLYRLISGLHTSISTQLTEYYGEKNKSYANPKVFFEKVGNHPERIENLYFAYSVLLRAINRAQEHIQNYKFETGNFTSDIQTKALVDKLYEITNKNCDQPFDESEIFSDISKVDVRERFVTYFHNISRILDCIECEVCRVYSKLQTYGMAAALKILFSEKLEGVKEINLKRNELIALINTFNKISTSIDYVDRMYARRKARYIGMTIDITIILLFTIVSLKVIHKIYLSKTHKMTASIRGDFTTLKKLE